MHQLATSSGQLQTRGQGGAPRCGMGHSRASAINCHQVPPARSTSLARNSGRGAKARLGFFFPPGKVAEFFAYRSAGLTDPVALAAADISQPAHQLAVQALPDLPEVVHVSASKITRFDAFEASDGAQGSVPVHLGKLPFKRGELPHVGSR